ncbi:hypothetical protein [Polyangium jinanense]|uniref:Lipoprotein n=1 Tax=Polyangium jinanense TaxID=2829994 RepID=A0A9X4ANY9_9BACT|nr:hypothetical protein [Polyangium jinanense]MDC3953406.1 hypothetical protein [Polyangium jinanense]MDC3979474.1 hypothetical protein [Polyangium jinanense]
MQRRRWFLLIAAVAVSACGRSESNRFTLEAGKVARVESCHLRVDHTVLRDDVRYAALAYVCDVPASALNEKSWWGDKPQPLGFSMNVGDCLPLDTAYYCVEAIEEDKASFKATYKKPRKAEQHLELIR